MSKDPIAMKHVLFLAGAATIALAPLSAQAAAGLPKQGRPGGEDDVESSLQSIR